MDNKIPVTPGCSNPSDIEQAISLGLDVVKFFPAEAAGGLAMIKAMSAPYVNMKFMPTGGISAKNLNEYLSFNKIIACGGSWMVKDDLIKAGEFDKIEALTREAVEQMLALNWLMWELMRRMRKRRTRPQDVRIHFRVRENRIRLIFAGTAVEVMKTPGLGAKGHMESVPTILTER